MRDEPYRNATAFRAGVETRLKAEARANPRLALQDLRRQFVLQRFLARVFAEPDTRWVLKGGAGLIVRIPGARHSNDLDLVNPQPNVLLDEAVADLRALAEYVPTGDFFRFEIADPSYGTGQDVDHVIAQVKVIPYLGTAEYAGRFPIDLSLNQRKAEPVELVQPRPIVDLPGTEPLPAFALYPLAEQVADKLCAMYGRYGRESDRSSTRYRDLVDLALVVTTQDLDAGRTAAALSGEASRRGLDLPRRLTVPNDGWHANYPKIAAETALPSSLHVLEAALETVALCIEPLLDETVLAGSWNPGRLQWMQT
ncbi:nucleotidyl transferase AbiEii/AbiGii toxin family protein [Kribbella sp. CA-294648]|uniref:nucleotidyl transferase AbiEii/AbiGii toxin family protein n=1 Tax=Kribbella sp. CA-294648 TaxID=3239948 RepID=UPI003D908033